MNHIPTTNETVEHLSFTTPQPVSTLKSPRKRDPKKIVVIVSVLLLMIITLIVLRSFSKKESGKVSTIQTEITPTPTQTLSEPKELVSVQVQNGTGTPGQAGTVVEMLTEDGYDPDNVESVNADEYEYDKTIISVKKGYEGNALGIKKILEGSFDEIKIESTNLSDEADFDVVIITGGKKYEPEESKESESSELQTTTDSTESEQISPTLTPEASVTP